MTEGESATFTITASPAPTGDISVTLIVQDDPDPGSDFLTASEAGVKRVTITGGSTTATLTVQTFDDTQPEKDGEITAYISSGSGYTYTSPWSATVAVRDNEPRPTPTGIQVSYPNGTTVNEGESFSWTMTLVPAGTQWGTDRSISTFGRVGVYTISPSTFPANTASISGSLTAEQDADCDDVTINLFHFVLTPENSVSDHWSDEVTVTVLDDDTGCGEDPDADTGGGNTSAGTGIGSTGSENTDVGVTSSTDATLSELEGYASEDGLEFNGAMSLNPDFATDTTNYTVTVPHVTTHMALTPTVNDPHAAVRIGLQGATPTDVESGEFSPAVALAVGENVIEVKVTAENGSSTRTYTVTVTREAAPAEPVVLDDAAAREHLFPLFADGEGFRSYLFLTNASDPGNRCTLELHGAGLNAVRFEDHAALTAADASIEIDLGDTGADVMLTTSGERDLALGYAKLTCTHPAVARMLLAQDSGGVLTAMTTLERANGVHTFQFPVLPQLGRLGLVLANDNTLAAACAVEVETTDGSSVGGRNLRIPAQSTFLRFLDELISMGDEAENGTVRVTCDREVAVLGVPLHGGDFAAMDAFVLAAQEDTDPEDRDDDGESRSYRVLPLVQDGGGFQSHLVVTNLSDAANQCAMHMRLPGVPAARFESTEGVTWDDFHNVSLELSGPGSQISLSSLNRSIIASFGHAVLDCDAPVDVRNLLTVSASDGSTGIAAISPGRSAQEVRFPVVPRLGSLALILTNDNAKVEASCEATLAFPAQEDTITAEAPVEVAAGTTTIRFPADLFELPDNFTGGTVTLLCDQEIAAISLPTAGAIFTAMPPVVPVFDVSSGVMEEEAQ